VRFLLDNQCAGHVRVTFSSADIEIGSCWRSHNDSQGLPRSNHNTWGTGRLRSLFRHRGLGGVHEDGAVELVHFPAGVVHGEGEWSRRSHPHKVRRKSEVFCGEGYGLHRPVACEEGGDDEAEDRDPTVHRQDRTELTRTQTPASIQESPRPLKWLSQPVFQRPSTRGRESFLLQYIPLPAQLSQRCTSANRLRCASAEPKVSGAIFEQFRLIANDLGSDASEKVT
jgi:hypothetical protein